MFDYAKTRLLVDRMLKNFGGARAVVLSRPSTLPPVYSTATGVSTPVAPEEYKGSGVTLDYRQGEIDGELIKVGDVRLYLSPFQTNGSEMPIPTTSDDIILGASKTYSIESVKTVSPGGIDVLHELQLRT